MTLTMLTIWNYSSADDKDPKIKIKLLKSAGGFEKTIVHWQKINHTNWQNYTFNFEVNTSGFDRLEITLDKELGQNEGVFLDNIQLYDPCETPENTCENPELFKPLLNIDLHQVEFDTTITGSSFSVKTIEVKNLEVANYATITITDMSGNTVYRTLFDGENPPSKIMWDGKNDGGDMMPDGWYKCKVVASNLCYGPETFTKKFKKESAIQVFDPVITQNSDGGIEIAGIYNAELVSVYVEHALTEVGVFFGATVKPEETIGWNGFGGTNESQIITANILPSGNYKIWVYLKSNCGGEVYSETFFINEFQTAFMYMNGTYNDPIYEWSVVPDKIIPPCDFYLIDEPFYRVPKNCCVGDLYLSDETLWGDMTFNILGTIHIDQSVVFDVGSTITMNAGEGFHLTPDSTSINWGSDVHLHVGTECEPCDCNKSGLFGSDSTDWMNIVQRPNLSDSTTQKIIIKEATVSPNPAHSDIQVTQKSNYFQTYTLFDLNGKIKSCGLLQTERTQINISNLENGVYYIRLGNGNYYETHTFIVNH